jgi:hypothetical protein
MACAVGELWEAPSSSLIVQGSLIIEQRILSRKLKWESRGDERIE